MMALLFTKLSDIYNSASFFKATTLLKAKVLIYVSIHAGIDPYRSQQQVFVKFKLTLKAMSATYVALHFFGFFSSATISHPAVNHWQRIIPLQDGRSFQ
jgi:hypothetical protein